MSGSQGNSSARILDALVSSVNSAGEKGDPSAEESTTGCMQSQLACPDNLIGWNVDTRAG